MQSISSYINPNTRGLTSNYKNTAIKDKKNNFDWHPQGTAEIEDGKKKIRQFENLEKRLRQKLSKEERRTRNNHLYNQEGT